MLMENSHTLIRWQRAAALATESACLLTILLTAAGELWLQTLPTADAVPPYLTLIALALLSGAMLAPLRLWRAAYYVRLSCNASALPSLRPCGRIPTALLWRWQLWWRRAAAAVVACLPCALLWGYGSYSAHHSTSQVTPLLWLLSGGLALLGGIIAAAVWQCRYVLTPLFILRGYSAGAAMALSAHAMRRHIGAYINFLGGELPALLSCLLLIPAVRVIPTFALRRTALLLDWMPSENQP
jgi:hypothetical protein